MVFIGTDMSQVNRIMSVDYAFPWSNPDLSPPTPMLKSKVRNYALDAKFIDLEMLFDIRLSEGFILQPLKYDKKDFSGKTLK